MTDLKYGDMICYTLLDASAKHDGPIMFVGPCGHGDQQAGRPGPLIDIMAIPEGAIDHKAPEAWQRCTHQAKA